MIVDVVLIAFIAASILLAGYYAGTETGFYRLNRVRLRFRVESDRPNARRLDALVQHPDRFVVTTLVGNNCFVFLATLVCTRLYADYGSRAELMATLTLIGPIFIFGEVLQKEMFRRSADVLLYRATPFLEWSTRAFSPVVFLLTRIQRLSILLLRKRKEAPETLFERHRLFHYFHESAEEGTLSPYQRTMAANIMRLQDLRVERVMIPRGQAISVNVNRTLDEFRDLVAVSPYRRFPVLDDSGKFIGVVNVIDALSHAGDDFSLADHVRPATLFRRDANVIDALHLLKRSRLPMGFVQDGAGTIVGIITIKDLVEEVVGELGAW